MREDTLSFAPRQRRCLWPADLASSPSLRSGEGGPREAWWKGLLAAQKPPPLPFRRSPSPVPLRFTGEEKAIRGLRWQ
jgi:hypothetical protein